MQQYAIPADILVVDDGSRDGSTVLLRQLESLLYREGLHVLALKQNAGLPQARNYALQYATHRYIIFMDADNELIVENLYQFYRVITRNTIRRGVREPNLARRAD